jgi:hypothetical protein
METMPRRVTRKLTQDPIGFVHAQATISRAIRNGHNIVTETAAIRLVQQEFADSRDEIRLLLRSDDIVRNQPGFVRRVSSSGRVSFRARLTETENTCFTFSKKPKRTLTCDDLGLAEVEELIHKVLERNADKPLHLDEAVEILRVEFANPPSELEALLQCDHLLTKVKPARVVREVRFRLRESAYEDRSDERERQEWLKSRCPNWDEYGLFDYYEEV